MPLEDDKPKDTVNSPFEASSVLVVKATFWHLWQKLHKWKSSLVAMQCFLLMSIIILYLLCGAFFFDSLKRAYQGSFFYIRKSSSVYEFSLSVFLGFIFFLKMSYLNFLQQKSDGTVPFISHCILVLFSIFCAYTHRLHLGLSGFEYIKISPAFCKLRPF